jgi:hypothetical protein
MNGMVCNMLCSEDLCQVHLRSVLIPRNNGGETGHDLFELRGGGVR